MMHPWKLAAAGMALIGVTAVSTGATTAYFMRPASVGAISQTPAAAEMLPPAPPPPPGHFVAARPASIAVVPRPAARVVRTTTRVTPVAAADCASTGDRAWRIAKPGAIGGLLGAGLGAAGGAIANGGKAAGTGALIGGLTGAVLGGGYGAYKTKQDCGTVFGGNRGVTSIPAAYTN